MMLKLLFFIVIVYSEICNKLYCLEEIKPQKPKIITSFVPNQLISPYRTVGKISFYQDGVLKYCVATVVGDSLLMTSGNCLFRNNQYSSNVTFYPSFKNNNSAFGKWYPSFLVVLSEWRYNSNPARNIGFIKMQPQNGISIGKTVGFLNVRESAQDLLINIITYSNTEQWLYGQVQIQTEGLIFLDTNFSPPLTIVNTNIQSNSTIGSPIYRRSTKRICSIVSETNGGKLIGASIDKLVMDIRTDLNKA